ncbi:MAG TPA: hypothetical protein VFX25_08345 [Streptosporangiaceae bacterium]|jgi:hypothetical protein|nr:hypothetical protein [Streptosporangiaceae bacterium]
MPGDDLRSAAARRDEGVRKVAALTWRAGAAGVIGSAVIALALGHHAQAAAARPAPPPGTIAVPNQPPAPAPGGAHVTSGGS